MIKAKISDSAEESFYNVVNKRRRGVNYNIELSNVGGTYRARLARRPLGVEHIQIASLAVGGWPWCASSGASPRCFLLMLCLHVAE